MSKHVSDNTKGGVTYNGIAQMSEDGTPLSTQIHNHIAFMRISRRRKIRLVDDHEHTRKLKIKKRLLEKLKKKKAKKSN